MKWGVVMIVIVGRSKLRLILLILAIGIVSLSYVTYYFEHQKIDGRLRKITLLIDPGHGGVDGGTHDHLGNLEKDINLNFGLAIQNQLCESGINIVMTREQDTDLAPFRSGHGGRHRRDLLARIDKARENKCLFLISIHCDSSEARYRQGAFVFYNYLSPVSKELAIAIQEEINKVVKKPGKAAPGKYLVIRQKSVTGVLVELGFLSNTEDARLLQNSKYRDEMSLAIAKGVLRYLREYTPED